MLEYKSIATKIKDIDDVKGIITGYFSVFNNVDLGDDIMRPGAFAKTIRENGPEAKNRIIHLFNHDPDKILSKPNVLKEDSEGLYFETKISKTTLGKDVMQWYADGVIDEHSIGFQTIKYTMLDAEKGLRELQEVKLWEGSTVTWGMNELAKVVSVKGLNDIERFDNISKKIDNIEKAIKNSKSDEGAYLLQLQIEELKKALVALKPVATEPIIEKSWLSYFNPAALPVR